MGDMNFLKAMQTSDAALKSIPFFKYGFMQNEMIWAHMIVSGVLARLLKMVVPGYLAILIILVVAVGWEIVEARIETPTRERVVQVYGSVERYRYDTAGDLVGALLVAALVVL